jgi:hypothetical protein
LKCLQNFPSTFTFAANFRVVVRATEIHACWLATSVISDAFSNLRLLFLLKYGVRISDAVAPPSSKKKCVHYSRS